MDSVVQVYYLLVPARISQLRREITSTLSMFALLATNHKKSEQCHDSIPLRGQHLRDLLRLGTVYSLLKSLTKNGQRTGKRVMRPWSQNKRRYPAYLGG